MCSAFTANEYSWFERYIVAHAAVTMETLPHFGELTGISKRTAFLKDGLAKYDVSVG